MVHQTHIEEVHQTHIEVVHQKHNVVVRQTHNGVRRQTQDTVMPQNLIITKLSTKKIPDVTQAQKVIMYQALNSALSP